MRLDLPIGLIAAGATAIYLWPSWTAVGGAVAAGLTAAVAARVAPSRILRRKIAATSRILKTACARVHQITPATPPKRRSRARGGARLDTTAPKLWRYIDVTVHIPQSNPQPGGAVPLPLWAPGLLKVVGPDAQNGPPSERDQFGDGWSDVSRIDIMQGGNWVPIEADKVLGSQRLRLLVGVPAGNDRFKLRYGFTILDNGGQTPT